MEQIELPFGGTGKHNEGLWAKYFKNGKTYLRVGDILKMQIGEIETSYKVIVHDPLSGSVSVKKVTN